MVIKKKPMPDDSVIPSHIKSGGELIIRADSEISFVNVYESPRQVLVEENTVWRGDIYKTSHPDNFTTPKEVHLTMRRGPDNKQAVWGRYLVKVGMKTGSIIEGFFEIDP